MGCNVSWAPDLDLATQPRSPAVGGRSFGDWSRAGRRSWARRPSKGCSRRAWRPAPSTSRAAARRSPIPHHGLPVVDVDARDAAGPRAGAVPGRDRRRCPAGDGVPRGVPGLEPDGAGSRPALRSPAILRDLLRDELGFGGVVVTRRAGHGRRRPGGCGRRRHRGHRGGRRPAAGGPGAGRPAGRAGPTARRVADIAGRGGRRRTGWPALRRWLGQGRCRRSRWSAAPSTRSWPRELARRSVTLVRDDAGLLPLRPSASARGCSCSRRRPTDLTPADTSSTVSLRLADAVRRRHRRTETSHQVPIDPSAQDIEGAIAAATASGPGHPGHHRRVPASRASRSCARQLEALGRPVVLVALRMPTDADLLDDLPTALACYSIHDPSTEATAGGHLRGAGAGRSRAPVHRGPLGIHAGWCRRDPITRGVAVSLHDEIQEQPDVARRLLTGQRRRGRGDRRPHCADGAIDLVLIAARGSSDHAAIYAQYLFGALHRHPGRACGARADLGLRRVAAPGARAGHRHLPVRPLAGRGGGPRRRAGAGCRRPSPSPTTRRRHWRMAAEHVIDISAGAGAGDGRDQDLHHEPAGGGDARRGHRGRHRVRWRPRVPAGGARCGCPT